MKDEQIISRYRKITPVPNTQFSDELLSKLLQSNQNQGLLYRFVQLLKPKPLLYGGVAMFASVIILFSTGAGHAIAVEVNSLLNRFGIAVKFIENEDKSIVYIASKPSLEEDISVYKELGYSDLDYSENKVTLTLKSGNKIYWEKSEADSTTEDGWRVDTRELSWYEHAHYHDALFNGLPKWESAIKYLENPVPEYYYSAFYWMLSNVKPKSDEGNIVTYELSNGKRYIFDYVSKDVVKIKNGEGYLMTQIDLGNDLGPNNFTVEQSYTLILEQGKVLNMEEHEKKIEFDGVVYRFKKVADDKWEVTNSLNQFEQGSFPLTITIKAE